MMVLCISKPLLQPLYEMKYLLLYQTAKANSSDLNTFEVSYTHLLYFIQEQNPNINANFCNLQKGQRKLALHFLHLFCRKIEDWVFTMMKKKVPTTLKCCRTFLSEAYALQQLNKFTFFLKLQSMTLLLHFHFEIVWEFAIKDFR